MPRVFSNLISNLCYLKRSTSSILIYNPIVQSGNAQSLALHFLQSYKKQSALFTTHRKTFDLEKLQYSPNLKSTYTYVPQTFKNLITLHSHTDNVLYEAILTLLSIEDNYIKIFLCKKIRSENPSVQWLFTFKNLYKMKLQKDTNPSKSHTY